MRKILALSLAAMVFASPAQAQELPPLSLFKLMMTPTSSGGWIGFREFLGHQLIYFTTVQAYHCHIDEIRYSINSDDLSDRFLVPPCDRANPYASPEGYMDEHISLAVPSGSAKSVHIQVLYDDGSVSQILEYEPCPNAGETTCVQRVQ